MGSEDGGVGGGGGVGVGVGGHTATNFDKHVDHKLIDPAFNRTGNHFKLNRSRNAGYYFRNSPRGQASNLMNDINKEAAIMHASMDQVPTDQIIWSENRIVNQ